MRFKIEMDWHDLGPVICRDDSLVFPPANQGPAVYRILVGSESYVGETSSLRRRLSNFRLPGGHKDTKVPRTNRRVNRWLLGSLATSKPQPHISFVDFATLHIGREQVALDLSRKDQRLLLENLIIQQELRQGHVLQNL
jgi:hypothetical protein